MKSDNNSKQDFSEIIELLIWAYKQGYSHASHVLKETLPDHKKLTEMFSNALNENKSEDLKK